MPGLEIPERFRKRLLAKPTDLQGAVLRCIKRLGDNPRHPGLQTHRLTTSVWEAYVDEANRVTFEYLADGRIRLRNHCNHDILKRAP
jgi:hypothetical protein